MTQEDAVDLTGVRSALERLRGCVNGARELATRAELNRMGCEQSIAQVAEPKPKPTPTGWGDPLCEPYDLPDPNFYDLDKPEY